MKRDEKLMLYNNFDLAIEKSKWHHIVYFKQIFDIEGLTWVRDIPSKANQIKSKRTLDQQMGSQVCYISKNL